MKKILTLLAFFTLNSQLIQAQYTLWGMTSKGGTDDIGTVFSIPTASNAISSQYSFTYTNSGKNPVHTKMLQTVAGKVFGMTSEGGTANLGVIFEYDPSTNVYTRKFSFTGATSGSTPLGSLAEFPGTGKLYGLTNNGGSAGLGDLGVLFEYDPATNTYTKKFDFDGAVNGSHPHGSLVLASNNKFYGMTYDGGLLGFGVLFEYDPALNTFTKKFDFDGPLKGTNPNGSLVMAADLKLYGMTEGGGVTAQGVLFQYDPISDIYLKKFDFDGAANGQTPKGSLYEATSGRLYGLTSAGGATGDGVLFEYNTASSTVTKKFDFAVAIGNNPNGDVVQASNGKLYGMTLNGGASGFGVLFEYDIVGSAYAKKLDYTGLNGKTPKGSLMKATSGKLYGLTTNGGTMDAGIVYEYDALSNIYTKKLDLNLLNNGASPNGSLNMVGFGTKFYGMTNVGGTNNLGTIFEWDPKAFTLTTKFNFTGSADGANPFGSFIEISGGRLCGMTKKGGTSDKGVLFTYDPVSNVFTKLVDFDGAS